MTLDLILLVVILLITIYQTFIRKYFERKGENLATKEDISEITRLTESAKLEFIQQIELYKKEIEVQYKFQEVTRDYKTEIFKKTVEARQNLINWSNNRLSAELIDETLTILQEIILDLFTNQILFTQYHELHSNIQTEFNNLLNAIAIGQRNGNFNFDMTSLQDNIKELQNQLLR